MPPATTALASGSASKHLVRLFFALALTLLGLLRSSGRLAGCGRLGQASLGWLGLSWRGWLGNGCSLGSSFPFSCRSLLPFPLQVGDSVSGAAALIMLVMQAISHLALACRSSQKTEGSAWAGLCTCPSGWDMCTLPDLRTVLLCKVLSLPVRRRQSWHGPGAGRGLSPTFSAASFSAATCAGSLKSTSVQSSSSSDSTASASAAACAAAAAASASC